jgi:RimJ/RimL family protein N-acetyltransferase
VLPQFQRAGYASEAAGALIRWAFSHKDVTRVIAETYPELKPSIRVMEKNGLRFAGSGSEERVIRYELTRADWEREDDAAS